MEPKTESYEFRNDKVIELHVIDVMLEAMRRHLDRSQDNPNCEQNVQNGQRAMERCAKYVLDMVKEKSDAD